MEKKIYFTPVVEVEYVKVENGFATSGAVENDYAPAGEAGMLQEGNTYEF